MFKKQKSKSMPTSKKRVVKKSFKNLRVCKVCGRTIKRKGRHRPCPSCGASPEDFQKQAKKG